MVCMYCKAPRLMDDAPCLQCGAPPPMVGTTAAVDQASETQHVAYQSNFGGPAQPRPQHKPLSLLPVPYQPGPGITNTDPRGYPPRQDAPIDRGLAPTGPNEWSLQSVYQPSFEAYQTIDVSQRDTALMQAAGYQLPTLAPLAPELSDPGESIHISPMYTKPRAIIPTYRIISGLLSFLIVTTLLCSGAVYYANASGKFIFIQQLLGEIQPPNLPPIKHALADPPINPDYGPAKNIIHSASTAIKIDPKNGIALEPGNVFAPNQVIYLTYTVHAQSPGVVVLKWYTDDILFKTITTPPITPAKNSPFTNGVTSILYTQPVEGKVELYWNNQLAVRLYFVVR
jgi:hypothetical protein